MTSLNLSVGSLGFVILNIQICSGAKAVHEAKRGAHRVIGCDRLEKMPVVMTDNRYLGMQP
jgi:hypothetical protein